jgi:hypothetical protein
MMELKRSVPWAACSGPPLEWVPGGRGSWRKPTRGPAAAGRRPFDAAEFEVRFRLTLRRVRRQGLRGFDARALALDIVWPEDTKGDEEPPRSSWREVQSRVCHWRRGEERRRERETLVHAREVTGGPWRELALGPEAEEVCGFVTEALRVTARNFEPRDLARFARGALARGKGKPAGYRSGTPQVELKVRGFLLAELLARGVERTDLDSCPGVGDIYSQTLRSWARECPRVRTRALTALPLD